MDFEGQFRTLTSLAPLPWQSRLFEDYLSRASVPSAIDIPTGLGKTAVMALWLIARANGAALPRRLVYVVDRRAVVDQATDFAASLRESLDRPQASELKQSLHLRHGSLPISTLRGQHVDNRDWLVDPSTTAIVVGTVDMIGSRLLFEGYGVSRKMRPYHAGLLGADTLVVLDEAHLVRPFEQLLETIAGGADAFGPRDEPLRSLVPSFQLMSLSATGRTRARDSFGLRDEDLDHPVIARRLNAPKAISVEVSADDQPLAHAIAEQAWRLSCEANRSIRCVVYCDKRKDAEAALEAVRERARGDAKQEVPPREIDTELFVGGRRVFEREVAAKRLRELGFIAGGGAPPDRPAFVFATSAGEVGVDMDADHMVGDVVPWERMVQRLGRVNRRGERDARVIVVKEPPSKDVLKAREKNPAERGVRDRSVVADADRKAATLEVLERLPPVGDARDAGPGAIRKLKIRSENDTELTALLDAATTPAPMRPALSRPLVDAWAMTSVEEHMGRPEIDPWLRGWLDDDPPQTVMLWRTHLPVRREGGVGPRREVEDFFEAAPPHASELLETESFRVVDWLFARAKKLEKAAAGGGNAKAIIESFKSTDAIGLILSGAGELRDVLYVDDITLRGVDRDDDKKKKEHLSKKLSGYRLVVDSRIGGLTTDGLLSVEHDERPSTADDGDSWMSAVAVDARQPGTASLVGFRVRAVGRGHDSEPSSEWRECFRLVIDVSDDGEAFGWLIVENASSEERRATSRVEQLVEVHHDWAEQIARTLAHRLGLPEAYTQVLAMAARLHDEGKRTWRWQRAFNARRDGTYAKTRGPINFKLLDGYRHEFGSLPAAASDLEFTSLPLDLQDLVLHLIAAHHGFARPNIGTAGCDDVPPSALHGRALEVALRFARLQKRWGPWGLAWWEALLRAVDQQASRDNETAKAFPMEKVHG